MAVKIKPGLGGWIYIIWFRLGCAVFHVKMDGLVIASGYCTGRSLMSWCLYWFGGVKITF